MEAVQISTVLFAKLMEFFTNHFQLFFADVHKVECRSQAVFDFVVWKLSNFLLEHIVVGPEVWGFKRDLRRCWWPFIEILHLKIWEFKRWKLVSIFLITFFSFVHCRRLRLFLVFLEESFHFYLSINPLKIVKVLISGLVNWFAYLEGVSNNFERLIKVSQSKD